MTVSRIRRAVDASAAWRRAVAHPGFEDVPVPGFSPATVSKLLADELLRQLFARRHRTFWVRVGEVEAEVRREVDRLLEVYSAHGWLDAPETFHREPPELDRVRIVSGRRGHHRFEHMTFQSGYEPHPDDPGRRRWQGYRGNRTAHAWLLRHTTPEYRPWVICLHGIGMGTPYVDFPAFRRHQLYGKLGFNVLWYVKPFHGPRRQGAGSHETFARGIANLIHVQSQSMWDLRRILTWIERQGASRLGVYGLSLGGYATALLTTLVDGIDVAVAGIPGTDFIDLFERNLPAWEGEGEDPLEGFWRDARRAMTVVSPFARPPRVPRQGRFIFGGLVDRLTPPERVRDLWLHWERPRIAWYPGSHVSFLLEPRVRGLLEEAFATLAHGPAASAG